MIQNVAVPVWEGKVEGTGLSGGQVQTQSSFFGVSFVREPQPQVCWLDISVNSHASPFGQSLASLTFGQSVRCTSVGAVIELAAYIVSRIMIGFRMIGVRMIGG